MNRQEVLTEMTSANRLDVPRADGRLRAMPQPQVRSDSAVGLLPAAGGVGGHRGRGGRVSSPRKRRRQSGERRRRLTRSGMKPIKKEIAADREAYRRAVTRCQAEEARPGARVRRWRFRGSKRNDGAEAAWPGSRGADQRPTGTTWCRCSSRASRLGATEAAARRCTRIEYERARAAPTAPTPSPTWAKAPADAHPEGRRTTR